MKVGYHFTTFTAYQTIQKVGLVPAPWEQRHNPALGPVREFIENGSIWIYTQLPTLDKLLGMILYIAIRHQHHHIILLAVNYEDWQTASYHARQKLDDPQAALNLTHDLSGIGPFEHFQEPFDLLITPITPNCIQVVGQWDLRQLIYDGFSS